MKIRNGYVSNSSSSSFVIRKRSIPQDKYIDELWKEFMEFYIKINPNAKNIDMENSPFIIEGDEYTVTLSSEYEYELFEATRKFSELF